MTSRNIQRVILVCIVLWCFLIGAITMALANTVWTQQPDFYHWYKYGTANKYLPTAYVEIPTSYIKQDGTYIKCTSTGGANKYWPVGYDCYGKQTAPQPPIVTYCEAKFVCHENWGWIVDLSQLKKDGCEQVKITKEQALFYDGVRLTNGNLACPVWPSN